MIITAKSLFHSNIVFVLPQNTISGAFPENSLLTNLYSGQKAKGAHFIDDSALKTKFLDLPELKLKVLVEPDRLRVEDFSQKNPEETFLVREACDIFQKVFSQFPLRGCGFNFDVYYRFRDVIRLKDLFGNFAEQKIFETADLRDLGVQFTLEKNGGKKQETYFIKIVAPIEIAVHCNHHFPERKLSEPADLQKLFEKCYDEINEVIENLKF